MIKPDIIGPESDPSVLEMLAHSVWEVPQTLPVQAHYGIPAFDISPRLTQTEIDLGDEFFPNCAGKLSITFADSYLKSNSVDELIALEGDPNTRVIYDGYTTGKDPRLMG